MLSLLLCRDILAIRSIDKYIIVAIGNKLHIFNKSTTKLIKIIKTLHQDVIHEIVKADKKLIVFGGKYLSIFQLQYTINDIIIKNESTHCFDDWIIAIDLFTTTDCVNLYILFAHNNLYLYNIISRKSTNLWCIEKCILYSGRISCENSSEAVIFSGTVFQEILIWQVNSNEENSLDIPVLHRLLGHKGVIFSIFYDKQLRLITSTSDDRTVRLWKINDNSDKTTLTINWNNVEINLATTIFGHTARVWKSIIVNNNIISIGEDSLICIWTLDGELCNNILAHNGATVWCIDISDDKTTLLTGGADGAVHTWPLIHTAATALIPTLTFDSPRTPKYVAYMNFGTLVVFLDGGELLCYNCVSSPPTQTFNLAQYKSYCLMQVCPNRMKIALASKEGDIEIFRVMGAGKLVLNKISERVLESKIFSMQWLNDETLLVCGKQGQLRVLKINVENKFHVQQEFTLPPSRECWTTAAIIIGDSLICGDRAGSVYVFSMTAAEKKPQQIFQRIHGRVGVQSFAVYGKKIISTGRDASLRIYKNFNNSLQVLHRKKMPMEWVCRILQTDIDLLVLGFKEIEFMIYSSRLDRLVFRIACGGGHRSWDCTISNGFLNFSCIKNKQIYLLSNVSCTFSDTLVSGYHTKEIHSLQCLPTATKHNIFMSASEDCSLRIGNIIKTTCNKYNLKPLDTYDGHISSVKCIAVINLQDTREHTKNLVFSGGGRAQLKVWEVNINGDKDELDTDDLTVIELTSFMLRGSDKDRRKTWLDKDQPYFVDPETRFMSISAYQHQQKNLIILFVACSDGFIRILSYNIDHNTLNFTTAISYYNRCIIKVHTFEHENELILISMATDGFVNLWNVNSLIEEIILCETKTDDVQESTLEPFARWQAHQSGINSYDFRENNENEYFLASGGDDNKLSLTVFTIQKEDSLSIDIKTTWDSVSIHAAQITGLEFLHNK